VGRTSYLGIRQLPNAPWAAKTKARGHRRGPNEFSCEHNPEKRGRSSHNNQKDERMVSPSYVSGGEKNITLAGKQDGHDPLGGISSEKKGYVQGAIGRGEGKRRTTLKPRRQEVWRRNLINRAPNEVQPFSRKGERGPSPKARVPRRFFDSFAPRSRKESTDGQSRPKMGGLSPVPPRYLSEKRGGRKDSTATKEKKGENLGGSSEGAIVGKST